MRCPDGMLRQFIVKLLQQFLEINKVLACVCCCRTRRFEFFKLSDPLAKSFDNSLRKDLNIESHHHHQAFLAS